MPFARKSRCVAVPTIALVVALASGCDHGTSGTGPPPPGGAQFTHVFLVTEENTDYADVIGNSAMPYLNGLAQQYGLATQYYANTHPSIGNYFMMTVGDIITNDDAYTSTVSQDNIVRKLVAAGKTRKGYSEDLPV